MGVVLCFCNFGGFFVIVVVIICFFVFFSFFFKIGTRSQVAQADLKLTV